MKVLVTGGAGYIGSQVACQLMHAGHEVVVADNLSTGHEWAVLGAELARLDLADTVALDALFGRHRFDAVLHFAASIVVPESVAEPLQYYRNNTGNTMGLLATMQRHGVRQLVFSSTAVVYRSSETGTFSEDSPLGAESPYGWSKIMSEQLIDDCARAHGLRAVKLRYFNVAGADAQARLGQASPKATHLIKTACEALVGLRDHMSIFGTDYPTPDGTCIRDYVHIEDLADAHVLALGYLAGGGTPETLNCGYGHGHSVREVLDTVQRVAARKLDIRLAARRPGDPPKLVARSEKIRKVLGWKPRYDDLEVIVGHALAWERKYRAQRAG